MCILVCCTCHDVRRLSCDLHAAPQLVQAGNIDYLVADYLSEITMSLLTSAKRKSPVSVCSNPRSCCMSVQHVCAICVVCSMCNTDTWQIHTCESKPRQQFIVSWSHDLQHSRLKLYQMSYQGSSVGWVQISHTNQSTSTYMYMYMYIVRIHVHVHVHVRTSALFMLSLVLSVASWLLPRLRRDFEATAQKHQGERWAYIH